MGQTYLAQVARVVATSKDVNTDIFSANLSPLNKSSGRFPVKHTLQIKVATADVVTIRKDEAGTTDIRWDMNGGVALVEHVMYHQDVYLYGDDSSYNAQLLTRSTTVDCEVFESEGDNT